jgi:hypothetical protein
MPATEEQLARCGLCNGIREPSRLRYRAGHQAEESGGVLSSGDSIVAIVDYIYLLLLNIMPYPENEITDVDVRIANCTVLLPWKQ